MSAKPVFNSPLFTRSLLVKLAAPAATALLAAGAAAGLAPTASTATVCSASPSSCVPCNVNILANNVTLNDDEIVAGGANSMGVSLRHTSGVTIENTTIADTNATSGRLMTGIKDVFSDSTGLVVNANNISNFETGVQLEAGLVENNYIHDLGYVSGDHTNGVMSRGDNTPLTITHNTIFSNLDQTDDIALFEDFSGQANRTITNNLLAGNTWDATGATIPSP